MALIDRIERRLRELEKRVLMLEGSDRFPTVYDGGDSLTLSFESEIDGGLSDTAVFESVIDGGNA